MFNTQSPRRFPSSAAAALALIMTLILALVGAGFPALVAASDPTPTAYPLPIQTLAARDDTPNIVLTAEPAPSSAATDDNLIAETAHYRFYVESGDFTTTTIPNLAARAETVYADVVARLRGFTPDAGLTGPITVIIQQSNGPIDSGCSVRGLAMYGDEQIVIFTGSTINETYFWGVLAHETAHMIHAESLPGFGNHRPLTEGLATWGSAPYWAAWMGAESLDDLVRGYLKSGDYLPLYSNYEMTLAYEDADCIHYRDILYSEWASFVGFLIDEYGSGRLGALMDSDPTVSRLTDLGRMTEIQPADFEGVYGQALNQLEARWLAWLRAEDA